MTSQWYVRDGDRAIGPFNAAQLKAQVVAGRIKPETHVRKGRHGKWIAARHVQGLHAPSPDTSDHAPPSSLAGETDRRVAEDEGVYLAPLRRRRPRLIVLVVVVLFILVGRAPFHQQLAFDLCVALILGSYPIVEVKRRTIEQTMFVCFLPVHKRIYRLRDFTTVETDVESRLTQSVGCLVLFFFLYWLLFRIFDHIMPWLGGDYKLWLRRYDDERIQIWQGNNTVDFEANLELLASAGLRIG